MLLIARREDSLGPLSSSTVHWVGNREGWARELHMLSRFHTPTSLNSCFLECLGRNSKDFLAISAEKESERGKGYVIAVTVTR